MASIQVLPQEVADQIAAGEVAERPAAVVKELVENAIDAGSSRIDVEIRRGGIAYIRVTDNGCGIPADQAETAFLRHATSKLSQIEDLYRIGTMGFRGEALASICAVADVELITKTADAEEGVCLTLHHGVAGKKEPIACGDGTTLLVENLFANIPARMKFLKKDSTESGYVADVLGRIALSRPDIAFSYTADGKEVFQTGGDGRIENVILSLYGLDHARALLPVDYTEEHIHISGVVGKPELSRGNRTRQTLFVNGRYVKNHVVSKVAEEAFRNSIMTGKFPFFVIRIELPPELVDVNVHPAKTEVKFANEKQIYDVAYHAVRNALYSAEREKKQFAGEAGSVRAAGGTLSGQAKPLSTAASVDAAWQAKSLSTAASADAARQSDSMSRRPNPKLVRDYMTYTIPAREASAAPFRENNADAEAVLEKLLDANVLQEASMQEVTAQETEQEVMPQTELQAGYAQDMQETIQQAELPAEGVQIPKVIGQVFDTYILGQTGDEMFLIDQHAAHERLRFETLKEAYCKQKKFSQLLLTPMVFNLDFREKQTALENLAQLSRLGFEIEDFGGGAVIVRATPLAADEDTVRELLLELLGAMEEQRRKATADFEEAALDMISCKYAIKANKRLSLPEMQDLIKRVVQLEERGVGTCPHGRPIRISFTKTEIEKLFKRKL